MRAEGEAVTRGCFGCQNTSARNRAYNTFRPDHVEFNKRLHSNIHYIQKQPRLLQFLICFSFLYFAFRFSSAITRDVPWVKVRHKCVCGRAPVANACLVYVEPREHVCWLQMSFSPLPIDEADNAPQIP